MHTAPCVPGRTLPAVPRTSPTSLYLWGDGGPPASRSAAAGPSAVEKKGVFQAAALPSRCHETILNVLRCASAMRNCNL